MARFIAHYSDGERIALDAADPASARKDAEKRHPGALVSKIKIDRTVHAAGRHGRLRMAPRTHR